MGPTRFPPSTEARTVWWAAPATTESFPYLVSRRVRRPSEATVLVHDPDTGELGRDAAGGTKDDGSVAVILTMLNKSSYAFDINDFVVQ